MGKILVSCLLVWALAVFFLGLSVAASEVLDFDSSATVVPAFLWTDQRCLIKEGRSIDYQVQSPESLGNALVDKFVRPAIESSRGSDEVPPEMIVVFMGNKLRSVDISRTDELASSDLVKTLERLVAGSKYSLSIPYVSIRRDQISTAETLVSVLHRELGSLSRMGEVAVSGSCSVGKQSIKRLAGVPDLKAYLETRKETRAHGETDVLMVCYTPYLDRTAPGTSVSEGRALNEVISNLRSSGTRHVALYTSDPKGATEGHLTISVRHLIDSASGNETTSCDAVCHSRARILEGVFVAIVLITILVSGLCCMMGVKTPTRFELPKES
ncbi:unnamed protein product [Sphagnum balticum]